MVKTGDLSTYKPKRANGIGLFLCFLLTQVIRRSCHGIDTVTNLENPANARSPAATRQLSAQRHGYGLVQGSRLKDIEIDSPSFIFRFYFYPFYVIFVSSFVVLVR